MSTPSGSKYESSSEGGGYITADETGSQDDGMGYDGDMLTLDGSNAEKWTLGN